MEQYGNASTYNIERVLYQNVQNSEYYKNNCVKLSTIEELIDEARSPSILHTRLWIPVCRGPSLA